MRILTVCIGNLCRSPLAERLLQVRLDAVRPGFEVSSAGVGTRDGLAMESHAAAQLERLGGSAEGFASRRLTPRILDEVDLVLTATKDIRADVLRMAPRRMRSTFTVAEAAAVCAAPVTTELEELDEGLVAHLARHRSLGSTASDVADPIGRPDDVHRAVADHLDELVAVLVPAFARLGAT